MEHHAAPAQHPAPSLYYELQGCHVPHTCPTRAMCPPTHTPAALVQCAPPPPCCTRAVCPPLPAAAAPCVPAQRCQPPHPPPSARPTCTLVSPDCWPAGATPHPGHQSPQTGQTPGQGGAGATGQRGGGMHKSPQTGQTPGQGGAGLRGREGGGACTRAGACWWRLLLRYARCVLIR